MGTLTENPAAFGLGDGNNSSANPSVVASTTNMPAPQAYVTNISGTGAIAIIDLPWPGFTGSIVYIPAAAATGVTSGTSGSPNALSRPIGVAFTCVANKAMILTTDGVKWYPSYTN